MPKTSENFTAGRIARQRAVIYVFIGLLCSLTACGCTPNCGSPHQKEDAQSMIPVQNGPLMFSRPPQYLSQECKAQLTQLVSDLFLHSEEVTFRYWASNERQDFAGIVLNDRAALQLLAEKFHFDSDVSVAQGLPTSLVFMRFDFMPSGYSLIFRPFITGREMRVFARENTMNYHGLVSHDFLLFCQYYFAEIIDKYGGYNMVDKTRLYTFPGNMNTNTQARLADFSEVVMPVPVQPISPDSESPAPDPPPDDIYTANGHKLVVFCFVPHPVGMPRSVETGPSIQPAFHRNARSVAGLLLPA